MIRVAFWYDRPYQYTGGLNYYKNLLFALSSLENRKIEPVIYFGKKVDYAVLKDFAPYATVKQTALLDRGSLHWFLHKVLHKLTGSLFFVNRLMQRDGISVVSHGFELFGRKRPYAIINWIPDFQYLRFPELFPDLTPEKYVDWVMEPVRQTDLTILSSRDAFNDFLKLSRDEKDKVRILHFVSQPTERIYTISAEKYRASIEKKYGFSGKFFFLPNQFWKHKNHMVVFEAVNLLKKRGVEILVLCTGNTKDYRSNTSIYADQLSEYIAAHGLQSNIKILGLIGYDDVLYLMRHSVSVINPSLFEGWSSTVEEAKSLGKNVVLSNIAVHVEQAPPAASYFDPHNPGQLAEILLKKWNASEGGPDYELEAAARENLSARTRQFGRQYQDIVLSLSTPSGI
ncbi:MAG: glycosyltransferase [Nitrospiraceae bacterium]|nr:glycosyltransferase [Nitrospiraceae bacterium]